jgi:glutaredoxin 3
MTTEGAKKVDIYSTPSCHFCQMAKAYFAEHNIPFTNYDVASDDTKRAEMIDKSGQMGVPVIIIEDRDVIVGFNQPLLAKLLNIAA